MQNLSTNILTKYFAKWSSPYANKFSNMAKVLLPFSSSINSLIHKMSNLIMIRYRPTLLESSEYEYRLNLFGKYKEVKAEAIRTELLNGTFKTSGEIILTDVGIYDDTSFSVYPIKGCTLKEVEVFPNKDFFTKELEPGESILDYTLAIPAKIYITSESFKPEDSVISIYGNDEEGNVISESFEFTKMSSFETFHKYKSIYKIVSPIYCNISNSLNLKEHHIIESNVMPYRLITDSSGDFIEPVIVNEDGQIVIKNNLSSVMDEIIRIKSDVNITAMYFTYNSDIIALDDTGWINTYKPERPFKEMKEINGSLNNNEFIFVEDEISKIGENINCRVYAHKIAERFKSRYIKVSIRNGDYVYFLNKEGYLTQDSNSWIDIVRSANILNVSVKCDNSLPYIFSVQTDNSKESFIAAAYHDISNRELITGGVSNMTLYNGEIIIEKDNKSFVFIPHRYVYATYDEDEIILDSEYKGVQLK